MELAPRRRKAKGHIRLSLRKVLQPLTVWHCSFQRFKAMHAKWIFRLQTSCWPSFRVNVIVSQFFSFQGVWRQEKTVPMCPFSYEIWAFLNCLSRRRQWHPTPVLLPGKISWMEEPGRLQSMGLLRVGHDWATSLSLSCIGEGGGNPLQCSCLENPSDGGAWWAAVSGVAQSRTDWSDLAVVAA